MTTRPVMALAWETVMMKRYFPKNVSAAASAAFRHLSAQELPVEKRVSQIFGGGNVSTTEPSGAHTTRIDGYRK
ncbi:g7624 [Coccomyxa elongata]